MKAWTTFVPFLFASATWAQAPAAPVALPAGKLPVREVTVFKDGHAYLVREAPLPADAGGTFVLDELPAPLLGTFWPFASDGARLVSAKAGREQVTSEVAAMDMRQIARANVGKNVLVVTHDKERLEGKLLGVPSRQPSPGASEGELLLLQTSSGTRALVLGHVRELEVRGDYTGTIAHEEQKERLVLTVAGGGAGAKVGVMYVQQGMRWIPAYRIDIDGAGKARVQFEATLVNDLVDLDRAAVNLVVGVPKFEFEGLVDPISLQNEMAQVAHASRDRHDFRNALSNSLRTQSAAFQQQEQEPGPAVAEGEATEDLFVFSVRDVTLRKGERLVLPIASFELTYKDVYRLDVPFAPPMEVRQGLQSERVIELARQMAAPKARHVLRLKNGNEMPLTTAPALVLANGRVLAQSRLFYTSKGREIDLEINAAIDIRVETAEHEVQRDPGPIRLGSDNYGRVEVAGAITLWNGKTQPAVLEVTRKVLGLADKVGQGGSQKQLDLLQAWHGGPQPGWWGWWSWPHWWFVHNGFGEFRWQLELAPGATTKLDASWHYFWR